MGLSGYGLPQAAGLNPDVFAVEAAELGLQLLAEESAGQTAKKAQLFGAGEQRPVRRKPVIWVHIHKAAGSFICGMAAMNGERIIEPASNCNWQNIDDFKQMGDGAGVSCERRVQAFNANQSVTWSHIEREFNDRDFCPGDFDYAMVVRDTLSLAQSEMNFRNFSVAQLQKCFTCIEQRVEQCDMMARDDNADLWKFFDNFQVRALGGMDTWNLPPGGVLEEHYEKVKAKLERFYRVIPFETLAQNVSVLESSFGWSVRRLAQKDPMGDWEKDPRNPNHRDLNFRFSHEQAEKIRELNRWDGSLYQLFSSRYK